MDRPETQLFMLMSVDGKISTGASDAFDFDQELPRVPLVSEGLHQYYELEKETDEWSLVTGRTMEKIFRTAPLPESPLEVTTVVVDNTSMSEDCLEWLAKKFRHVVVATSEWTHPAWQDLSNVECCRYEYHAPASLFRQLYANWGCKRLTIQSGGTLNDALLHAGLIDHVNIVVAPLLVGGAETPSLVDGLGLQSFTNLSALSILKLVEAKPLENSYLQLRYDVVHDAQAKPLSKLRLDRI